MGILSETRPIKEPYSEEVLADLNTAWEVEKERLMDADVTIPRNVEPLARRIFFSGYVTALNAPPF